MIDPDAPSMADPKFRHYKHWVVVNIPANDVTAGQTLTAYIGAGPPKGTGFHRYVFLVYEQQQRFDTSNELIVANSSVKGRASFKVNDYAGVYNVVGIIMFSDYNPYNWCHSHYLVFQFSIASNPTYTLSQVSKTSSHC